MNLKKYILLALGLCIAGTNNSVAVLKIGAAAGARIKPFLEQYLPDRVNINTPIGIQEILNPDTKIKGRVDSAGQTIGTFIANPDNYNTLDALITKYSTFDPGMASIYRARLNGLRAGPEITRAPIRRQESGAPQPPAPSSAPQPAPALIPAPSAPATPIGRAPSAPTPKPTPQAQPSPKVPQEGQKAGLEPEEITPPAKREKPSSEVPSPKSAEEGAPEVPELPAPARGDQSYGIGKIPVTPAPIAEQELRGPGGVEEIDIIPHDITGQPTFYKDFEPGPQKVKPETPPAQLPAPAGQPAMPATKTDAQLRIDQLNKFIADAQALQAKTPSKTIFNKTTALSKDFAMYLDTFDKKREDVLISLKKLAIDALKRDGSSDNVTKQIQFLTKAIIDLANGILKEMVAPVASAATSAGSAGAGQAKPSKDDKEVDERIALDKLKKEIELAPTDLEELIKQAHNYKDEAYTIWKMGKLSINEEPLWNENYIAINAALRILNTEKDHTSDKYTKAQQSLIKKTQELKELVVRRLNELKLQESI